jgi:hypothetical protein
MTRARNASDEGLTPHWKIRLVLSGGAILHSS